MKTPKLLVVLTLVNLTLLAFNLLSPALSAMAQGDGSVLRGRALEIVDERGKVRASIKLYPVDPKSKTPDGRPYPETVLLRLITSDGRPNVKLSASELGGSLVLGGQSDPTYARLAGDGGESSLLLKNKDGRQRLFKP